MPRKDNKGENNPMYGKHHTKESKRKQSETKKRLYREGKLKVWNQGKTNIYSEETLEKMRKPKSEEYKRKMSEIKKRLFREGKLKSWNKGTPMREETKIKLSKINKLNQLGEKNPFYGKKHSKETIQKMKNHIRTEEHRRKLSIAQKGKKASEETKEKMRKISTERWKNNKEYREKVIKNALKALLKKPSSFESKLKEILDKIQPNEWKYTGDGSLLIGFKNPDFCNSNGKKIVLEVYHDYFKIRDFGSCENYEKQRREHFAKYGYDTIFIDKNHLNEESVKNLLSNQSNAQSLVRR